MNCHITSCEFYFNQFNNYEKSVKKLVSLDLLNFFHTLKIKD